MTSDSPSGDSLLVLNAKYHPNEGDRNLAGREFVLSCVIRGNHGMLALIVRDDGFTQGTRKEAADALEQVLCGLLEEGYVPQAAELVSDRSIPYQNREKIGLALVSFCRSAGTGEPLVKMLHARANCPHDTLEECRRALMDITLSGLQKTGDSGPIEALALDRELPQSAHQFFGMKLYEILSSAEDLPGLLKLAEQKGCHDEPRKAATFKLFNSYKSAGSYTSMQALVENQSLLYEARKSMALGIADICIESGNYPLLVSLSRGESVPLNIRLDLEDRIELAAGKAAENAITAGDRTLLSFLSNDERLGEVLRDRCAKALEKLERPTYSGPSLRQSHPPPISDELAATLARKMGRASQPPPPTRKN
ncbi:MAG TPA: hypothetical protein VLD37_04810 [Candidatus Bilamarchaeum sp.]|nr:hypothetical protein [Candidatus Bilamarchaeum sp.]